MNSIVFFLLLNMMLCSQIQPDQPFKPEGLFLTWQRDPASTMTIQWLEKGGLIPAAQEEETAVQPFSIGYVETGSLSEMGENIRSSGYQIDFLANTDHQRFDPAILGAKALIGWNEAGMVLEVAVTCRDFRESDDPRKLWNGSSVEIILAAGLEAQDRLHLAMAPGIDPRWTQPRCHLQSPGAGCAVPAEAFPMKVAQTEGGYRLLAVIPWSHLPRFHPAEGRELHAQIYVNNAEGQTMRRKAWFPSGYSGVDSRFTHRIRLALESSAPYRMSATVRVVNGRGICSLYGLPEKAGASVRMEAGGKEIATGFLTEDKEHWIARADLPVPLPAPGTRWGTMKVMVEGESPLLVAPTLAADDYCLPPSRRLEYWVKSVGRSAARVAWTTPITLYSWPGYFMHRVELTGLLPDTEYYVSTKGDSGGFLFRTMPAKMHRSVRIALGGDTLHRKEWMTKTSRMAVAHDPDFIIWGGDLADANAERELLFRWKEWFDGVEEALVTADGRRIPVIVAVGNHDVDKGYWDNHPGYEPTDEWRKRLAPEFFEFFPFPGQPGYNTLDFGDYLSVIILDSDHTNPVAGAQTQWLESVLKKRKHIPHVLPVYHVPAYPSTKSYHGKHETEVRSNWTPLFDEYAVRSVFEHHNHAYKRTYPIIAEKTHNDGTIYFGDGAWGVRPRAVHPTEATWYLEKAISTRYALVLTLEEHEQHFTAYDEDGEILDEVLITPKPK